MNESDAMSLANNAMGAVDWDGLHTRSRAIFDAVHRGSSLALQSGLYGTPPERPDMTRALPNYEQRDPNELAMLRHREMVRPQAGRADFPIEHVANMATAGAAFTPVGAALAPEFLAGRAIAAGAQYAPKLTTAALGLGGAMAPSMAGGAEDQNAVKELQAKLRDAGLYRGEIDGRMGPGTQRAKQEFDAAAERDRAATLRTDELRLSGERTAADTATASANARTAEAKLKETERQAEVDRVAAERKSAGDERLRDIEKDLSPVSRAIRDYAGPIGYGAGAVMGAASRYGITSVNNAYSKARAVEGDAIMAEQIAGPAANIKGVARTTALDAANAQRVARANEFWRKGGGEVPFVQTPGQAPGYAANPNATALGKTYNPNVHPAVEATATALPAAELTVAHVNEQDAKQEVKDAIAAYGEDPSEANIQRINKANDNVAIWSGLSNFGRVWGGSQLLGAVGSRYTKAATGTQPNMAPAEAEQLALQKALRDAQAKADAAAKKAAQKEPSVLERRQQELGVGPPPPALVGSAAWRARQQ